MTPLQLAILPVFFLILIGYTLRRLAFLADSFWPAVEKLTYYILFPALLVHGLAGSGGEIRYLALVAGLFISVLLLCLLLLLINMRAGWSAQVFGSVLQGAIRPNTYIGLSLAVPLLGKNWPTLSGVCLLTLIPLVNFLSVAALLRCTDKGGKGRLFLELVKNPLIFACVVGLLCNGLTLKIPVPVDRCLELTGRAALPLGLMAVGAGIRFGGVSKALGAVLLSSLGHLIVLPLLAFFFTRLFHGTGQEMTAAVLFTAIPVAISSYILSRQMGGDEQLMARIITLQTLASLFTIPLMLQLLLGIS
jgi:predicted permease